MAEQAERKRWYSETRVKIALGVAAAEGLVVAVSKDWSKWTLIIIAVPIILFYLLAGRTLESNLGRQTSWVLAASQALAVIVVVLWYWVKLLTLIAVAVFAVVALYLLFVDRPSQHSG
jgi:FtsH-binding integral membrane protein